jgi:hypothetical protein
MNPASRPRNHRVALCRMAATISLLLPGAAYPYTLDQLLHLPLERLLQLQVATPRAAPAHGPAPSARMPAGAATLDSEGNAHAS